MKPLTVLLFFLFCTSVNYCSTLEENGAAPTSGRIVRWNETDQKRVILRNPFRRSHSAANTSELRLHVLNGENLYPVSSAVSADETALFKLESQRSFPAEKQSTLKIFKTRPTTTIRPTHPINILEYTLVWRNKNQMPDETDDRGVCIEMDTGPDEEADYWQTTFVDYTAEPSLNLRSSDIISFTLEDSMTTPLIEYLFLNQAGFGIILDDALSWRIDLDSAQSLCFISIHSDRYVEHQSVYQKTRMRILIGDNIRQVYVAAVMAGHIPHGNTSQLPQRRLLEYPYWSTDYFTDDDDITLDIIRSAFESFARHNISSYHLVYEHPQESSDFYDRTQQMTTLMGFLADLNETCRDCRALVKLNVNPRENTILPLSETVFWSFTEQTNQTDSAIRSRIPLHELIASSNFAGFELGQLLARSITTNSICPHPVSTQACAIDSQSLVQFMERLAFSQQSLKNSNYRVTFWAEQSRAWHSAAMSDVANRPGSFALQTGTVFRMQTMPIIVRLDYYWNDLMEKGDRNLKMVLVDAQTVSLAGYPYMQPHWTLRSPTFEAYIRWIQVVTFLPSMFIPGLPWDRMPLSSQNTSFIVDDAPQRAQKFFELHRQVAMPAIEQLTSAWLERAEPIVRPLWWAEPDASPCFRPSQSSELDCDSQFMLGPDLVIAPIVDVTRMWRNVYLPPGCWRTGWTDEEPSYHAGPQLLRMVEADLDTLLYFTRSSDTKMCTEAPPESR